ncbi:DUF3275 family protein, partial [Pseudomonas aeruginosa]|uniref:DUF3275 family protein n=1 Tax=Pseudomonas aeruginosa TaxID=287 RepID=UPI00402B1030
RLIQSGSRSDAQFYRRGEKSDRLLGEIVKLDTTVDRKRLRQQCVRLGALGYELDFKQQVWTRKEAA